MSEILYKYRNPESIFNQNLNKIKYYYKNIKITTIKFLAIGVDANTGQKTVLYGFI